MIINRLALGELLNLTLFPFLYQIGVIVVYLSED